MALGLIVAAALGEVGVRLWGGEARLFAALIARTRADLPVHEPSDDPELLYRMVPGVDVELNLEAAQLSGNEESVGDLPRRIQTNSQGFRDREWPLVKAPGVIRILCFGGSNTYGAAVTQTNTWPAQLQSVLEERGHHVEVWNLGVDGYKTRQKLRLAEIALERFDPDLLVFQLANTGPRLILDGMELSPRPWLDPSAIPSGGGIYRENLAAFPPPGSLAMEAARRSALLRVVLIASNRIWQSRWVPPRVQPIPLVVRADTFEGAAFERFLADADGRAETVIFVPPAGGRPDWLAPLDLPLIDTRYGLLPPHVDIAYIHPGARTYRWYAERLADGLERCLERADDGRVRCIGGDTTGRPEPDL